MTVAINNNTLVIDNVQEFAELVNNYDRGWKLLLGRKISRIQDKVKYKSAKRDIRKIAYYQFGKVVKTHKDSQGKFFITVRSHGVTE
jgi:hypothetical protein